MGWNKVKAIKRISRKEQGQHGRAGAHTPAPYKQKYQKNARDYISEWDEIEEENKLDEQNRAARTALERQENEENTDDSVPDSKC